MWRALVGLGRLGSGCLVLRADTRENPGGKNRVMTVDTIVTIVYRVVSSSTKSTTLTLIDTGSQKKNLSKWNRTPKGSSNFGNVRVHLFVDTIVTIVYRVVSSPTKVRPSHLPTSIPKK